MNDSRFRRGISLFNEGDYFDAAELFEEVFFEAVREEVELTRVFLQASAGMHHIERGQARAAVERLEEAVIAIDKATDDAGIDLVAFRAEVVRAIEQLRGRKRVTRPKIDDRK